VVIQRRLLILYLLIWSCILGAQQKSEEPFITLEPLFSGTLPLFPGQQAYIGYRFTFNADIDLTQEILPLLEATGFKKLGEKQIDETVKDGLYVHQILQRIEAIKPGEFAFEPSFITGYAYTVSGGGEKIYNPTPLKSEVPALVLTVAPFPQEGKPPAFNGALGNFSFTTQLAGSNQVNLGQRIDLLLKMTGEGEWDTVKHPKLCCQPGFSGFFKELDLPPTSSLEGQTKTFQISLFVENRDAKAIPSLAFAFFNPVEKKYGEKKSDPISIKVSAPPAVPLERTVAITPLPDLPSSFPLKFSFTWQKLLPLLGFLGILWILFQTHYQAYKS
jgi:hypothetical protein